MTVLSPDEISRVYSETIFDVVNTDHRRRKIICPLPQHSHSNYTASFSIYWAGDRWRWQCHGNCGLRGDVIDLVGYTQIPGYSPGETDKLKEAIYMLTGERYDPVAPTPPIEKDNRLMSNTWSEYYPAGRQVKSYAETRGISQETMERFKIGQATKGGSFWMTIPTFHDGHLLGIKMRNIGEGPRYRGISGSKRGLFNYDGVLYNTGRVFVVKGEIAAMVLLSHGLLACAPTGGEGMRMTQSIIRALALADLVVIGDNDPDSRVRAETRKLAERRAIELNGQLFFPPEEYKDVDEWILHDPKATNFLIRVR
jgi:hypothetical protein